METGPFLSPKVKKKRPQSLEPSPHKYRVKKRQNPMSLPSFLDSSNDTLLLLGSSELSSIDEPNRTKIRHFSTEFPSYNANTLSMTQTRASRKLVHPVTYEDSSEHMDSSDVGFGTLHNPTDGLSSEFDLEDEDDTVDAYIQAENSSFGLHDPFDDTCVLSSQKTLNRSDLDEAGPDLDKTPIFKRSGALKRALSTSSTPFWRHDSITTITPDSEDSEPSSDLGIKLDKLGRLTVDTNRKINVENSSGTEYELSTVEDSWVEEDVQPTRLSRKLIKLNKGLKKEPGRETFAHLKVNTRVRGLKKRVRLFTRTNSTTEHPGVKKAKEAISVAVDESKYEVVLEMLELPYIPDEIEDLKDLVCVDSHTGNLFSPDIKIFLTNNKIRVVNPRIFNLDKLEVLSLRNNKVSYLPGKIRDMKRCLRYLQISGNKLRYLPSEILELEELRTFSLRPNTCLYELGQCAAQNRVLEVVYSEKYKPDRKDGNTPFAIKRYISEMKLNCPGLELSVHDFKGLLDRIKSDRVLKAPKLSLLCLRTLKHYDLSNSELKKWEQSLSKHHQKVVAQTLQNLVDERLCYSCKLMLTGEIIQQNETPCSVGSIVEYYDILEVKDAPILKEFCSLQCVGKYLETEILRHSEGAEVFFKPYGE